MARLWDAYCQKMWHACIPEGKRLGRMAGRVFVVAVVACAAAGDRDRFAVDTAGEGLFESLNRGCMMPWRLSCPASGGRETSPGRPFPRESDRFTARVTFRFVAYGIRFYVVVKIPYVIPGTMHQGHHVLVNRSYWANLFSSPKFQGNANLCRFLMLFVGLFSGTRKFGGPEFVWPLIQHRKMMQSAPGSGPYFQRARGIGRSFAQKQGGI